MKICQKNAPYRKTKGTFCGKTAAKNAKCFLSQKLKHEAFPENTRKFRVNPHIHVNGKLFVKKGSKQAF